MFGTSSLYEGRAPYFLKLPRRLASRAAREGVLRQNEAKSPGSFRFEGSGDQTWASELLAVDALHFFKSLGMMLLGRRHRCMICM